MSAPSPSSGLQARLGRAFRAPIVLGVIFLWLVLIACETTSPLFFLHDDNADQFIAFFVHDFRVLTETGHLAEINYYQYAGDPFLEQGQTAVLYPPVYLAVALARIVTGDFRWTVEWMAALHLTLGLLGFYAWMRQMDVERLPATLGGLAWVLNPFILIVASSWINVTMVACYLPWIFWGLDRLFLQPRVSSALALGGSLGLFFLQGTVQWVVYTIFFLAIYATFRFLLQTAAPRLRILYDLVIAVLIFFALTLPLLVPMLHAADASVERGLPMPMDQTLAFSLRLDTLWAAQIFAFQPNMVFSASSAMLYCPALLLFPLMVLWLPWTKNEWGRRLFPLLLLFPLALFFSTHWHAFLHLLPVFNKFRWPYKVFIFAEFFLLAGLVISLASYAQTRTSTARWAPVIASGLLAVVLLAGLITALTHHEGNYLSNTTLPDPKNPLLEAIPTLGRVISLGETPLDTTAYRDLTYLYGTFYQVPVLGGYNPLSGRDQLDYGLGIAFTNLISVPINADLRETLNAHSARYWIVDRDYPYVEQLKALPALKLLRTGPDRLFFENERALPLAFATGDPKRAYPVTYAGNSLLVSLDPEAQNVAVSVSPNDGWWYRLDHGPWRQPAYRNLHLQVEIPSPAHQLEIRYFDPRFRKGLLASLLVLIGIGVLIGIEYGFRALRHFKV